MSEWSSDTGKYANHELRGMGARRGDRGKRTTFYGWCSCGYGVPSSVNVESVKRKHRAHVEQVTA